jgi:peptide subunit release factor RF-3
MNGKDGAPIADSQVQLSSETTLARDSTDTPVLLLAGTWALRVFADRNPDLEVSAPLTPRFRSRDQRRPEKANSYQTV